MRAKNRSIVSIGVAKVSVVKVSAGIMVSGICLFTVHPATAQSAFSTGDKDSSLILPDGAILQYSFNDPTVTFGYSRLIKPDPVEQSFIRKQLNERIRHLPRYGIELKGKADKNVASFFRSSNIAAGGRVSLSYGWYNVLSYLPSRADSEQAEAALETAYEQQKEQFARRVSAAKQNKKNADEAFSEVEKSYQAAEAANDHQKIRQLRNTYLAAFREKQKQNAQLKTVEGMVKAATPPTELIKPVQDKFVKAQREFLDQKGNFQRAVERPVEPLPPDATEEALEVLNQGDTALQGARAALDQWNFKKPRLQDLQDGADALNEVFSKINSLEFMTKFSRAAKPLKPILESARAALETAGGAMNSALSLTAEKAAPRQGPGGMFNDLLAFNIGYGRSEVSLLDSTNKIVKRSLDGLSGGLVYNADFGDENTPLQLGIGLGMEPADNAATLTEVEVREQVTVQDGGTTRVITKVRKALQGTYKQYTGKNFNTDLLFRPEFGKNRLGIDLFTRWRLGGGNTYFSPGIGTFLLKKGNPNKTVAGVILRRDDDKTGLRADLVANLNF